MQFEADPRPGLTVASGMREGAFVVRVHGELDYHAAPVLRRELRVVWEAPAGVPFILDLSEVIFCDSVGLSELITTLRHSRDTGRPLLVSGVHGTVLRVLTITGLRAVFDTYDSVDDALLHTPSAPHPVGAAQAPVAIGPERTEAAVAIPPIGELPADPAAPTP